jgi:fructokinase
MQQANLILGIDWGGTKIEIAALDDAGTEHLRRRVATPRHDYEASVRVTAELVQAAERELGRTCPVGVGIPGSIAPATGLVQNANSDWLIGRPLKEDLESALGRELRLENDANCLALSEARDGAAAGAEVVFAAILGTGCGAGVLANGMLLSGRPCYCGRKGCLETWISGTGFARDHEEQTGQALTAEEIVQAMRRGDAAARSSYRRLLDRLGRGLAGIINILDPNIIVLGGGLSNVRELYTDLPPYIMPQLFSKVLTTPIVAAQHGDSSGVRGAAWLWR